MFNGAKEVLYIKLKNMKFVICHLIHAYKAIGGLLKEMGENGYDKLLLILNRIKFTLLKIIFKEKKTIVHTQPLSRGTYNPIK